ncbi:transcription elongation factor B, polypeptide 2 [Paragonimus westermani]|uniref:Transcription elongation factor B, polypeptide 2 n=1 Tax=Paragonimus westermani TaxID=34504 RepID=A0A5J4NC76_9TREM|nr:transcription elongation factor B, polypeptide 2 [Paragonimus westermani]
MEVYMVIRRKKTTIHLNARETSTIREVKMMIEGILKVPPSDQMLFKQQAELDDEKTLAFYNLNAQTARAHTPATLGLALRDKTTDKFEVLDITPYSNPPELPEVMRCQENMAPQPTQEISAGGK